MSEQTKECSFRAETIKAAAIACRFCGRYLDEAAMRGRAVSKSLRNCPDCGSLVEVAADCLGCGGRRTVTYDVCYGDARSWSA